MIFDPFILKASDGYPLNVYEAGRSWDETVVIAGPPTIPFVLMSKLAASLSRHYHVLAWETRGGPWLVVKSDGYSLCLDRHAQDLAEILRFSGKGRTHYVGWCGGSWIVGRAILRLDLPVASVSLIAPNYVDGGREQTNFQKFIAPIIQRVIKAAPDELDGICKVLENRNTVDPPKTLAEQQVGRVADLNTGNSGSIGQWARTIWDFGLVPGSAAEPTAGKAAIELFDELCARSRLMLMHCRDDDIVSYKCSLAGSERNPGSKLVLYPTGGHSVAYLNEPAVFQDILSFIRLDTPNQPADDHGNPA